MLFARSQAVHIIDTAYYIIYLCFAVGLGGLGGMNALAVLFAVKIKLLIVAAIVGLSVYYFSHTRSNSWGETIVPYSA